MKTKITIKDSIISLILLSLSAVLVYSQTHLKAAPQIILFVFGGLTVILLFKFPKAGTVFFYTLLGIAFIALTFLLMDIILDLINPNRNIFVDMQGESHPVMDFSIFLAVPVGLSILPLFLWLYHKKLRLNKILEMYIAALFTIASILVFVIF